MDQKEIFERELAELRAMRDRLTGVDKAEDLDENSADIREYLKDELDLLDKEIKELEANAKKKAKRLEEFYDNIKETIDAGREALEGDRVLSNEDIYGLEYETDNQKNRINVESSKVQEEYNEVEKIIKQLKRDRTKLVNKIKLTEALGLTYNEYNEIYATIKSENVMNKIYESKGLASIIEKKASERTKEEKEILKKAKEEAITEIAAFRRENVDRTVLESITIIYLLDTKVKKGTAPRVFGEKFDIENAKHKAKNREHKIKDSNITIQGDKVEEAPVNIETPVENVEETKVEEAPKDMENATQNVKVDLNTLKPAEEKVTLFKDIATNDYYVRRYAVDRFKLPSADKGNGVRINGSLCYKISEQDVNRIKENANNAFSPYITDVKEITLIDEKIPTSVILPEDTKDEFITGTNIKRPRDIKIGESEEAYNAFLEDYYNKVFPQQAEEEKENKSLVVVPETQDKSLMVIPQPEEKEELEEYVPAEQTSKEYEIEENKEAGTINISFSEEKTDSEEGLPIPEIAEVIDDSLDNVNKDIEEGLPISEIAEVIDDSLDNVNKDNEEVKTDSEEGLSIPEIAEVIDDSLDNVNKDSEEVKTASEEGLPITEITEVIDDSLDNVNKDSEETDSIVSVEEISVPEEEKEEEVPIDSIVSEETVITPEEETSIDDSIVSVEEISVPEKESPKEEAVEQELEATNIKASEEFKGELKKGGILYNIVHTVPKLIKEKLRGLFKPTHEFDGPEDNNAKTR